MSCVLPTPAPTKCADWSSIFDPILAPKECSICMDWITKETGETILSCSHNFHLMCIVKWYNSQNANEQESSCPNCRNKVGEKEDLPEAEEDEECETDFEEEEDDQEDNEEEEDEEEEDEEDSTELPIPINPSKLKMTVREFCGVRWVEVDTDIDETATKIQSAWRGHCARRLVASFRTLR